MTPQKLPQTNYVRWFIQFSLAAKIISQLILKPKFL